MENKPDTNQTSDSVKVENPQIPQPVEIPIVTTKNKWYKKRLLWIIVSALLLVGAGVGYAYYTLPSSNADRVGVVATQSPSPSPESTENTTPEPIATKTYTSQSLGVAFDYPATWTVTGDDSFEGDAKMSDRRVIESPDGFTLFFLTLPYGGLGGTGPCNRVITDFNYIGEVKISDAHIVQYVADGQFYLQLSNNATKSGAQRDCLEYNGIVKVREPITKKDELGLDVYTDDPYAVLFGTDILFETAVSTTKPSDSVLSEAIAILKSLRRA